MRGYEFKDWLTVEEAAAWLTDNAGKPYDAPALYRAIEKRLIQAYYWPAETVTLGVFVDQQTPDIDRITLTPMRAPVGYKEGRPLEFRGPVPFNDYGAFLGGADSMPAKTLGIRNLETLDGGINGGIYILGPNDESLSLNSICYKVLVHIRELEAFASTLAATLPVHPPQVLIEDSYWFACCDLFGDHQTPFHTLHSAYIDQPPTTPLPAQALEQAPATLKALAFAAHLIANLAERLDEHETVASQKLGLKKAGKPTVSAIAHALEKTARQLNYDGHGYGKRGFQEALGKALKTLE